MFVTANLTDKDVAFAPEGVKLDAAKQPLLAENFKLDGASVSLGPWGYVAIEF